METKNYKLSPLSGKLITCVDHLLDLLNEISDVCVEIYGDSSDSIFENVVKCSEPLKEELYSLLHVQIEENLGDQQNKEQDCPQI